jgi:putative nucleotidyltransferase with HDIG domain
MDRRATVVLTILALLILVAGCFAYFVGFKSWAGIVLVGLLAFLARFLDVSLQGEIISPSSAIAVASLFLFGTPQALFVLFLSLLGVIPFRRFSRFSKESLLGSLASELGGFLGALTLYRYIFSSSLAGVSLSSYSLELFLAIGAVFLGYFLTLNIVSLLNALILYSSARDAIRVLLSPLYFGLHFIVGLSLLLLVPTYSAFGLLGFFLGLIPLSVFFFATKLYLQTQEVYRQSLRSLVGVIEAMDPYTHGHSDRVAYLSLEIGKRMGLTQSRLQLLEYAAYLHDMGKVSIDPSILHKPASLTEEEWKVIKAHPEEGVEILRQVKFLKPILPWVEHHHEKANGTGYPGALSLEKTPVEARIITLADAFDAMTSNRPYRPALSFEETLKEIQKGAGSQFDPAIVRKLERLLKKRDFLFKLRQRKQ